MYFRHGRCISPLENQTKRTRDWNNSVLPPVSSQNTHRLHSAGNTHTHSCVPVCAQFTLFQKQKHTSKKDAFLCVCVCRADLAPPAGQFFSHLLSLEPECVNSTTHLRDTHTVDTHQVRIGHADTQTTSRLNRMEALKACAASLSSRIENEARKLVSYRNNDDDDDDHAHRVKPPSPPERERPDSSSRIHNDVKELPGVGNLYGFITQEGWGETAIPRPLPASTALPFSVQEEKHDSSGGSISEGLLSDCSLSDPGDDSAARHDRIALFQKEAELHTPYRPVVTSQPWEEFSKGSPHSVINIFAKNINKYSNGKVH